jgi:hypothetical protein
VLGLAHSGMLGETMSDRGSGSADALVRIAPKMDDRSDANDDPLEKAGHLILDMVRQAAGHSQADYQQGRRDESQAVGSTSRGRMSLRQNFAIRRTGRTGRIGRRSGCIISRSKLRANSSVEIKPRHVADLAPRHSGARNSDRRTLRDMLHRGTLKALRRPVPLIATASKSSR